LSSQTNSSTSRATPPGPHHIKIDPLLVDEYVEVRAKVLAWKPNVNPDAARYAELHAKMLEAATKARADQAVVLEGKLWKLPITHQEQQSTIISIPALQKKLGLKWLLENCSVTLAKVRKAIPRNKLADYILTERTGNREVQEPVRRADATR